MNECLNSGRGTGAANDRLWVFVALAASEANVRFPLPSGNSRRSGMAQFQTFHSGTVLEPHVHREILRDAVRPSDRFARMRDQKLVLVCSVEMCHRIALLDNYRMFIWQLYQ